jgi:hypothetical protein
VKYPASMGKAMLTTPDVVKLSLPCSA